MEMEEENFPEAFPVCVSFDERNGFGHRPGFYSPPKVHSLAAVPGLSLLVPALLPPFSPTEPRILCPPALCPPQVGGAAVLAVGVWTLVEKSDYLSLLASGTFTASACILVVAGSLVAVTGYLGCCAVIREQRSCLSVVRRGTLLPSAHSSA